jgi:hypothetical protein
VAAIKIFLLALGIFSQFAAAVDVDVGGSSDPLGIKRYPHSWIVGYENDTRLLPREYALSRVDKTRRHVRVEHEVRASATRQWAIYEMPAGTQADDVIEHYLKILGGDALFSCRGRDCGRSNHWANYIFKQAILFGPDGNQYYLAAEHGDHLMALYIIERGNKRVYAHLEALRPESKVALTANQTLIENLAGDGLGVIDGLTPGRNGSLDAADLALLAELGQELMIFDDQKIYVVCHLYGSEDPQILIERSQRCAEAAVKGLAQDSGVPLLAPFAAGPLLPRTGGRASRLELVLPHRLSHKP